MNVYVPVEQVSPDHPHQERSQQEGSHQNQSRHAQVSVPWRRVGFAAATAVAAGVAIYWLFDGGVAAPVVTPPPVTVAVPLVQNVTEWDDYVGRFTASQTVDVRPRVSGQIVDRHFTDGDLVTKGQVLFTIDQRPFQATQAAARADVESAASTLALAQADLARANRLKGDEAVSQGEVDQLRARVRSAQAAVASAQARLRSRELDMEFTEVRAPIAGRISDRRVDVGNLVVGGETTTSTLLTTINALDPIYFTFDASEALFLKARREQQKGGTATTVQIRLQDEPDYRWSGHIDFTDNGLDPRSGTIRGRAVIANPDSFLAPGLFGDMRLALGEATGALLVPDAAIQSDQARKTLLVVDGDNNVVAKPVVLGPMADGLRIIRSGLGSNDRVVIVGMQNAIPGTKVAPNPAQVEADTVTYSAANQPPAASQATISR